MTFVVREAESPSTHAFEGVAMRSSAGWKRRICALYEHVRAERPGGGVGQWRQVREALYRTQPRRPASRPAT